MGIQGLHDGTLFQARTFHTDRATPPCACVLCAVSQSTFVHSREINSRAGNSFAEWQVFKWVRKAERCEFKGEAENGEGEDSSFQDHSAAGFETEAEASQRRLTRGKAADMGLDPELTHSFSVSFDLLPTFTFLAPLGARKVDH